MHEISAAAAVRPGRLRTALTVTMLLVWVCWAVLAWWATPRAAGLAQLDRDVAAGRVVGYERADGWQDDDVFLGGPKRPRTTTRGATLVWTVTSGQTRFVDLWQDGTGPGSPVERYADRLARTTTAGDGGDTLAYRLSVTARLVAVALWLTWLAVLVRGAPPRWGTRWYWFWIGLVPYGVGMLAWLYREWWRPAARRADRYPGWFGFGVAYVVGFLLHLVVLGLRELLGGRLVPG